MERIIKFSLPDYKKTFDSQEKLKHKPYCICYQYNVSNQCGPYGFNTERSQKFIENTFGEILQWNMRRLEFIRKTGVSDNSQGINFYGNLDCTVPLYEESQKFLAIEKKNILLDRFNKKREVLPKKPLMLDLFDFDLFEGEIYKSLTINKLIELKAPFFISVIYGPEAWKSLILFDENLIEKIKHSAHMNDIEFLEVDSINDLSPW